MSFAAMASDTEHAIERNNVVRLAIAQALAGANSTVTYATAAVVGKLSSGFPSCLSSSPPWRSSGAR